MIGGFFLRTPLVLFCLMSLAFTGNVRGEETLDFAAKIAPIFQQHCLRCHSDENAKGDFSLTTPRNLRDDAIIAPGDPDGSHLIDLISAEPGRIPEMPKESTALTTGQVALLRRWIAEGAEWPKDLQLEVPSLSDRNWWSLLPIVSRGLPEKSQSAVPTDGSSNPVDFFLDQQLAANGLKPVKQADPLTLLRRLTYDLTGLPPTVQEIDAFLLAWQTDPQSAWNDHVDRMLASPAFGEKYARHWLDVVRYAETHGYDKDKPRMHAWPYRDYVISSFNNDKPLSRFVQEQVAGDALFPEDPDGILGLGFLAAGPWDFIGHTEVGESKLDGRIAKHLDRDEMISAVFNVFQSTTVQCAQCHHHKFDPIRMEDYYRLHAIFAAVDRADRVYAGLSREQEKERQLVVQDLEAAKHEKEKINAELQKQLAAKGPNLSQRIEELKSKHGAEVPPQFGFHSQIANVPETAKWIQVDLGRPQEIVQVRMIPAYDTFAGIGAGFGFPVRYKVEASEDPQFSPDTSRILLDATAADQTNPRYREIVINGDGAPLRYLRVTATKLALRQNDYIFALGELEAVDSAGTNVAKFAKVMPLDSIEAGPRWGAKNLTDGIFYRPLKDPEALQEFLALETQRAAIEVEIRTPEIMVRLQELEKRAQELSGKLSQFPRGQLVYAAATEFTAQGRFIATGGKPREIHLLHRGDLRSPGDRMTPAAPHLWDGALADFNLPEQAEESIARARLAEYLTDRSNPLLWRSIVNRLWQWSFGSPLVGTPNDFGRMGMQPTHPELLDYLAARLRDDQQQSLKSLVRLFVTSNAYRRASEHDAKNSAIDADNRLLWRFNRRRLTAEELRDGMLAISGVLKLEQRGGPSFQDFVIEKPQHSPHFQYHLHDPADPLSHRRSIYRFIVRSQPQPMLTTLDCADPSMSVPRRDESTTALQALTQWNNRLVEAMSRSFAARLRNEGPQHAPQRIEFACRLAWGRLPEAREREVLTKLLQESGEETLARVLLNTSAFSYVD